jgi:hypothetical protein
MSQLAKIQKTADELMEYARRRGIEMRQAHGVPDHPIPEVPDVSELLRDHLVAVLLRDRLLWAAAGQPSDLTVSFLAPGHWVLYIPDQDTQRFETLQAALDEAHSRAQRQQVDVIWGDENGGLAGRADHRPQPRHTDI